LIKPKIILVIATSLDGRIAFPNGGESHIGSTEDKKILNESLINVDATLFGSGTLKAHQSTYLVKNNSIQTDGEISINQPISIVTGNSKKFSNEWLYFKQPIQRWLINSNKRNREEVHNFDKQFLFNKSWKNTLTALGQEGLKSIALLGGAKLIYSFLREDLIDEIKITISPRIIGGEFTWVPFEGNNQILNFDTRWNIKSFKVLKTSEIFIHYTKIINNL